jgi:hypothetical protein
MTRLCPATNLAPANNALWQIGMLLLSFRFGKTLAHPSEPSRAMRRPAVVSKRSGYV